ncbi:MAG TPA: heavy metal-binding domain-containing protein [Ktedonobacterales bacterium]|nr:heavy metal-binding domain-containing protein [Ktedonobacterales bacterium]
MMQQFPPNQPPGAPPPGSPPQNYQQPPQGVPQQQLPQQALERLQSMRGAPGQAGLFTSDLSVNEYLLVKSAGFEPLGLVVGSSIYHLGFQFNTWKQDIEVTVLSQAMYQARELAMTRMEQEAAALGADGIVGVRLEITFREWGAHMAEFIAIGTAVRSSSGGNHRNVRGLPFTSDLSGQDFYNLVQAGYMPVGLVIGSCVWHVAYQGIRQWFKSIGNNVEMANYTQGLYNARETAMARMQAEAMSLRAQGVVGAQVHEKQHGWGSHVLEYFAIGTAIVQTRAEHTMQPPQLTLSLNDAPPVIINTPPVVPGATSTTG